MNNGQVVFRVRPSKQNQTQSISKPLLDVQYPCRHTRKAHTKSRGGCLACKQRRKKCDERKPTCTRCLDKDLQCRYVAPTKRAQFLDDASASTISPFKWPGAPSPAVLVATLSSELQQHTNTDLYLLDHFVQHMGQSVAGPEYATTITVQALGIAKEVPFLMHAMLALSACHLQHNSPNGRAYRYPEALHTQLASQGLRHAITDMSSAQAMDSVLTTSMILNCLAYCYTDHRSFEPNLENGRPSWQWLRIMTGLKDLLIQTRPFHNESIWLPMFIATKTFNITEPLGNDLDVRIAAFCGITNVSTSEECPYLDFYNQLAPLVTRTPSLYYLRLYSNAIGGIDYRFVELLEHEDDRAMLLFGHWLALMCSCVNWWSAQRTMRECWMLCRILDARLEGEDRILLERPAEACGYPLDILDVRST